MDELDNVEKGVALMSIGHIMILAGVSVTVASSSHYDFDRTVFMVKNGVDGKRAAELVEYEAAQLIAHS